MIGPARTPPRLITLICLTGISTLSLNMFLPSLVSIAADFGAGYAIVSLSIAGYLAATAILQIIFGPLSDRFGRRPVLLAALTVFCLASIGAFFAQTIWVFLLFRMFQGAIIAGAALSPAVVRDTMPAKQAASMLGYIAMAMAIAPMLGPMLGGALEAVFGWRSNFALFAILGTGLLFLTWADLGETNRSPTSSFRQQLRAYPVLLSSAEFWAYGLCMAFSTGSFYVFLAGAPLVSRTLFGTSPAELGIYMGSITAGYFLGSFISGRLSLRHSLATMMIAGRIVACAGLLVGIGLFLAGVVHEWTLFGATIFVGVGNGITMPGSSAGVMSVRPDLAGSSSGLAGALTVGAGAVLTSAAGVVLSRFDGALPLLAMMLATAVLGLVAAMRVAVPGDTDL